MNTYYCLDDSPRFEMIELNEIDSTNNFLKSYRPLQPKEVTLVTAEFQTAGRGQIGNSWESESGENLLFSLLIHPQNIKASQQFLISQISALSAKEALEAFTDGLSVKWPNDIYVSDRKICGILIENTVNGGRLASSIIGVGLNLNQKNFPPEIPNPVSLSILTGKTYQADSILPGLAEAVLSRLAKAAEDSRELREAYIGAMYRKDKEARYVDTRTGMEFSGIIRGISDSSLLLVELPDGRTEKFAFKEIAYIIS